MNFINNIINYMSIKTYFTRYSISDDITLVVYGYEQFGVRKNTNCYIVDKNGDVLNII